MLTSSPTRAVNSREIPLEMVRMESAGTFPMLSLHIAPLCDPSIAHRKQLASNVTVAAGFSFVHAIKHIAERNRYNGLMDSKVV